MQSKKNIFDNKISLILGLISSLFCLHLESAFAECKEISNDQAIQIAKNEITESAKILGYNLDQMGINATKYYTLNTPYVADENEINSEQEYLREDIKILNGEVKILKDSSLRKEKELKKTEMENQLKAYDRMRQMRRELKNKSYWVIQFFTIAKEPNIRVIDGGFNVIVAEETGKAYPAGPIY